MWYIEFTCFTCFVDVLHTVASGNFSFCLAGKYQTWYKSVCVVHFMTSNQSKSTLVSFTHIYIIYKWKGKVLRPLFFIFPSETLCVFVLFFLIYRPHRRNHHRGQWAVDYLPPWTSSTTCWPPLPATQREPQQSQTELLTVISARAGGERHRVSSECSCSVIVCSCVICIVLVCLVSSEWVIFYIFWNDCWLHPEDGHEGISFRCGFCVKRRWQLIQTDNNCLSTMNRFING